MQQYEHVSLNVHHMLQPNESMLQLTVNVLHILRYKKSILQLLLMCYKLWDPM